MESETLQIADRLETEVCGRCGGTGHYSYNQINGTVCFGCGGKGRRYSKRGKVAAQFLEDLRKVPAGSLKIGDLMRYEEFAPSGHSRLFWLKIESIELDKISRSKSLQPDGTWKENPPYLTLSGTYKGQSYGLHTFPDQMVRKGFSAEEKQAQLRQALEHQATLKPNGKPYKRLKQAS